MIDGLCNLLKILIGPKLVEVVWIILCGIDGHDAALMSGTISLVGVEGA